VFHDYRLFGYQLEDHVLSDRLNSFGLQARQTVLMHSTTARWRSLRSHQRLPGLHKKKEDAIGNAYYSRADNGHERGKFNRRRPHDGRCFTRQQETYCLQLLIVLETKTRTSVPTVRRLVTVEICRNKSTPKVKLKGPDELKAGNIE